MAADPVFQVVVNWPQVDVFGFHRPEVALEVPEVFICLDGLAGAEFVRGGGCADDVDSVQRRLGRDFVLVSPPAETPVADICDEVLADLALMMTLPALIPIFPASFSRPACTDALILPSSSSVAA